MELAAIFLAGFGSVFLLGFQSRNVNNGNYRWAAATSFLVAIAQASLWSRITAPDAGTIEVVVYGLSGSTGITAAMHAHARLIDKKGKVVKQR